MAEGHLLSTHVKSSTGFLLGLINFRFPFPLMELHFSCKSSSEYYVSKVN